MRKAFCCVLVLMMVGALVGVAEAQQRGGRGNLPPEERAARQAEQDRAFQEEMAAVNPIGALDSVWIEELTWMEVRDALKVGKTTAIVPTGGVEPNGIYLATGKHNYVLAGGCDGIARKLGNALCAPIIKLVPEGGHDPQTGHMRFPGTISLRAETFQAVLEDVGMSLRAHGFEHIIYIGDSGGNQRGMEAAAAALNERWGQQIAHFVPEWYRYNDVFSYMEEELGISEPTNDGLHDNFVITSLMMLEDPTSVRYEQRVAAARATINGLCIAPKEMTIDIGKQLMQFRIDTTVPAIEAAIAGDMTSQQ